MTVKRTIILMLLLAVTVAGWAQKTKKNNTSSKDKEKKEKTSPAKETESTDYKATPNNMWEVGVHGGYLFAASDVATQGGYGAGLHLRKSLDYIFSIRGEALYGNTSGTAYDSLRNYENNWVSGTVFGLFNLNSLRWNKPYRSMALYLGAGAGANYFETQFSRPDSLDRKIFITKTIPREITPHVAVAAGISFRVGKRFNVGLDHQVTFPLGSRGDLIDGLDRDEKGERTGFGDMMQYSNLRLNFNIGNSSKNSEPLYWINPLDIVLKDVSDMKKNQDMAMKDSDGDGVIDAIDQEPNTPPDVEVDTKGRVLDSDRDGVPNHKDKEPYNPPRSGEVVNNEGIIEVYNPEERTIGAPAGVGGMSGSSVTEDRVRAIVKEELQKYNLNESAEGVADWFLPMIHFGISSYAIKYSDYGTLAGIARMLKSNSKMRLVVTGFTDQTGPQETNDLLSYQRAKSVLDHFVSNHGISADRLVLQYKGQEEALVPASASYMNRRVEFRVASAEDVGMDAPSGADSKKKDGY